ncbi:S1 family peptidase [Fodinicola acaciae]|uniref:S1 family peptidase n=1 Tax=Fodinicola acaciae TaxID=2681555 RepID=UPI0013D85A7F|nr:serine protease [Fodinicola acaciae]
MRKLPAVLMMAIGLSGALVAAPAGADPVPPRPTVVGGVPVPDGKYPFMASLQDDRYGSTAYDRHFCGGSLIAPAVVLTAQHCVSADPREIKHYSVIVGRTRLTDGSQGQERKVAGVAVPDTADHDVALLYLEAPVTGIKPIRIVTAGTDVLERPGTLLTASGWGSTVGQDPGDPGGNPPSSPDRMQEVDVPVVSDDECLIAYPDQYQPATQMCAGHHGKDTCQGDSGGPLFKKVPGRDEYVQAGTTWYGAGCAALGYPGVYTRLSNPDLNAFIHGQLLTH